MRSSDLTPSPLITIGVALTNEQATASTTTQAEITIEDNDDEDDDEEEDEGEDTDYDEMPYEVTQRAEDEDDWLITYLMNRPTSSDEAYLSGRATSSGAGPSTLTPAQAAPRQTARIAAPSESGPARGYRRPYHPAYSNSRRSS
jgi:hypothetical protein